MKKVYVIVDDTNNTVVGTSVDMISSVEEARYYHEHSKHHVLIYKSKLVGELQEEELIV